MQTVRVLKYKTTRSPRDIAISCKSIYYNIKFKFIV